MVSEIQPDEIIAYCNNVLSLDRTTSPLSDTFLAGMIRQSAGYLCPCSRKVLVQSLEESLTYLVGPLSEIRQRVEKNIENLTVAGDLLEIDDVTYTEDNSKRDWIFPAPPSFVRRHSGGVFVLGVVADQDRFLPQDLADLVETFGCLRYIANDNDESVVEKLRAQGLHEIDESAWLKTPKFEHAEDFLGRHKRRLTSMPACGPIPRLTIIDPIRDVKYYRGRWVDPLKQSGDFVGRRPRDYGPDSWCFVRLVNGVPEKVIDLPFGRYHWRGCDAAWHLQMALDYCRGTPQYYSVKRFEKEAHISFFSPLPIWSKRRLSVIGAEVEPVHALKTYSIPLTEVSQETQFLAESLWLVCDNDC